MKQYVIKAGECLEKLCDKVVVLLGIIIFSALSFYSMRYTELLLVDIEIMRTHTDSVVGNLFAFCGAFGFFSLVRFCLSRKSEEEQQRVSAIVKNITLLYVLGISVLWVFASHTAPRADAKILCQVANLFLNGDYESMVPVGYMSYNPHQFGLVFVLQSLSALFGDKNYVAFQYMNAALMVLAVYAGYKIVELIFKKAAVKIFYCIFIIGCLPVIMYVAFVYGEIPSIAFCMVMMWCAVKYCKTGCRWAVPGMVISAALAGMVRMNSVVVIIAISIVLIVHAVQNGKPQTLLIVIGMFLAVTGLNSGIRNYYEYRSGNPVNEGIPYASYIMMGLQDAEYGPGWFNRYNYESFEYWDFDHEATKVADTEAVKMRLSELWNNKTDAMDFFKRKILTQWNAPDYNAIESLERFDCEFEELPKVIQGVFSGELRAFLEGFMNRYQFVLYFCSLCVLLYLLCAESPLENHVLLIAIIGGLLFSCMWEAKSRYVLPYMFFMVPLAAAGMYVIQEGCVWLWNYLNNKKAMHSEEKKERKEKTAA